MQLTIDRAVLLAHARAANTIADARSPLPIDKVIALEAGAGTLRVSARAGQRHYSGTTSACDVRADGAIRVDAAGLVARVDALPPGLVTLQLRGEKLTIKAGKRLFTVPILPDEFRLHEIGTLAPLFTMSGDRLSWSLDRVSWAADPVDAQGARNAVVVTTERDHVRFAALRGSCIACLELTDVPVTDERDWQGQLSLATARDLHAFARAAGASDVAVTADDRWLVATRTTDTETHVIAIGLCAFRPIDAHHMLATVSAGIDHECVVDHAAFVSAVKAATIASNSATHALVLARVPGALHVVTEDDGAYHEALPSLTPCTAQTGHWYAAALLLQQAAACSGDDLSLSFADKQTPTQSISAVRKGEGFVLQTLVAGMDHSLPDAAKRILAGSPAFDQGAA